MAGLGSDALVLCPLCLTHPVLGKERWIGIFNSSLLQEGK